MREVYAPLGVTKSLVLVGGALFLFGFFRTCRDTRSACFDKEIKSLADSRPDLGRLLFFCRLDRRRRCGGKVRG